MEHTKTTENGACRIAITGRFTFADHTAFKKFFEIFKDKKISRLEIDLKEVEFVDSAALGLLLLTRDEAEKTSKNLVLKSPHGQVKKMFEISRFYELFDIVG